MPSSKEVKSKAKELGPSKPVAISAFKSDKTPTDVVSQNISSNDCTGSVS